MHLDSLNPDYVFESLVRRLRGSQSGSCGCRSHGTIALKFAAVIAIMAVLFVTLRPPSLRRQKIGCMSALLDF